MSDPKSPSKTILRRREVEARTGLARSTIYERVKLGTFPAPIRLGAKAVGWLESEIETWISNCVVDSRKDRDNRRQHSIGSIPRVRPPSSVKRKDR
jgi:prophage regulatory protein